MKKLLLVFSIAVSSFGFGQDYGDSLVKKDFLSSETIERYIVFYINEERVKLGLDTLAVLSEIDDIAKNHSAWMLQTRKYQHSGLNIDEIIMKTGTCSNRYSHKFFARAIVNAWMNSPAHKDAIIDTNFKYIGVGMSYTIRQTDGYISEYYTCTFDQ